MIELLPNKPLIEFIRKNLVCRGKLFQESNGYLYLKIHDDFIHQLIGFIDEPGIQIPDYFSESRNAGAHITVVYSEERSGRKLESESYRASEEIYDFKVENYFKAKIQNKFYFGCTVKSSELEKIRLELGLETQLNFRGVFVPFHFTIAIKPLK